MISFILNLTFRLITRRVGSPRAGTNTNEDEAIAFLEQYNEEYGALLNKYVKASWNYETNLTDENANYLVLYKFVKNWH